MNGCSRFVVGMLAGLGVLGLAVAPALGTTQTVNYGPFRCVFYGNGDTDGSATGVADWTSQQMADIGAGIAAWDGRIANTQGRQITMHLFWYEFGNNGILGGSYSPTNGNGTNGWTYSERVWRDGVNYSGPWSGWDTIIEYDVTAAGFSWNFGAGSPGGSQIDFRSVITHEIGHSIGFYPTYDPSAYDDWGNGWGTASSPYGWAGYTGLTAWDRNLMDSNGNRASNGGNGTPGNFDQTDNPVYWTGTNAVDYNDGNVPIYAPSPYENGSSLSHLDESTFPNALMSPFIGLGQAPRAPTELEWAMMKDMGWNVLDSAVPEPSTLLVWSALTGLGLVAVWRRRRQAA